VTGIYATVAVGLVVLASVSAKHPLQATAEMERLAAKVQQTKVIPVETRDVIERVFDGRPYDCSQVSCNAELSARNRVARAALTQALANKSAENKLPGTTGSRPVRHTSAER